MVIIDPPELDATILHVSDTQFGKHHRFTDDESLAATLIRDLERLANDDVPRAELIILSGDIAEMGLRSEFDQARLFVDRLCEATGLDYDKVVAVPGNHDVNWALCRAYFNECEADETDPRKPYPKKWKHYRRFVTALHGETAFTDDQPYQFHRFDDLGLAVAALNSTMEESHENHYGWCGTEQLRWAAARFRDIPHYVRIAVLHHNARRKPVADNENLHDENDLTSILGPSLDLLLHGHTHDGREDRLSDGTLVLATGSAAVTTDWRPAEVPNQYQILRIRPNLITRWARQWDSHRREWMGDNRISQRGDRWQVSIGFPPTTVRRDTAFPGQLAHRPEPCDEAVIDFVAEVLSVTKRDVGDGEIRRRRKESAGLDYLIVARPTKPLRCVGVHDGPLDLNTLNHFDSEVFDTLRGPGGADFVLVHHGPQDLDVRTAGLNRGIRVKTWTEYNDLLDPSPYRTWLRTELENDTLYPQGLYLPQRSHTIDRRGKASAELEADLLSRIYRDVLEEGGRFVLVLGDAGFGKSFLVRRLAYLLLTNDLVNITPIIIYLRDREKGQTIDEMVSTVLLPSRAVFKIDRFQHSLNAGTLVLLVDGYDEFAVRVGYNTAADQLRTFIQALRGKAKIVLTTRPNHFRSHHEATSALFDSLRTVHDGQVHQLEPFDHHQQRTFLERWFELDGQPATVAATLANRWMDALSRVDNLPELAKTPRMLSFMVRDLDLTEVESIATTTTMTAAALYDRLVELWLAGEADVLDPGGERTVTAADRRRLAQHLAFDLWRSGERDLTERGLQDVARSQLDLPRLDLTADQAAQLIGSRTVFQVGAGRWRFAHQSIWEYLLACHLAERLREGEYLDELGEAELTQLTIRFLRDLAPEEATAWAARIAAYGPVRQSR